MILARFVPCLMRRQNRSFPKPMRTVMGKTRGILGHGTGSVGSSGTSGWGSRSAPFLAGVLLLVGLLACGTAPTANSLYVRACQELESATHTPGIEEAYGHAAEAKRLVDTLLQEFADDDLAVALASGEKDLGVLTRSGLIRYCSVLEDAVRSMSSYEDALLFLRSLEDGSSPRRPVLDLEITRVVCGSGDPVERRQRFLEMYPYRPPLSFLGGRIHSWDIQLIDGLLVMGETDEAIRRATSEVRNAGDAVEQAYSHYFDLFGNQSDRRVGALLTVEGVLKVLERNGQEKTVGALLWSFLPKAMSGTETAAKEAPRWGHPCEVLETFTKDLRRFVVLRGSGVKFDVGLWAAARWLYHAGANCEKRGRHVGGDTIALALLRSGQAEYAREWKNRAIERGQWTEEDEVLWGAIEGTCTEDAQRAARRFLESGEWLIDERPLAAFAETCAKKKKGMMRVLRGSALERRFCEIVLRGAVEGIGDPGDVRECASREKTRGQLGLLYEVDKRLLWSHETPLVSDEEMIAGLGSIEEWQEGRAWLEAMAVRARCGAIATSDPGEHVRQLFARIGVNRRIVKEVKGTGGRGRGKAGGD